MEDGAVWLEARVEQRRRVRMEATKVAWRAFIADSLKKGARALHEFVKREEVHQGESVEGQGGRSGLPQAIVNEERRAWVEIWHRFQGECDAPWRTADLSGEGALDRPTAAEVRKCARSFKANTAVGWDCFAPRWIGWLSDELMVAIIDFFETMEQIGCWPQGISRSLVHLIPKTSGGRRPIGVLATFARIWEAARKPIVWRWRKAIERPYNWAATGRSAEMGVWGQSLKDEVARSRGMHCGAVMFDLTKAYEMVKLALIWDHGREKGFPLRLLRLILGCFSFTRHLVFRGVVAEGVDTYSAILAGSVFALDALAILMTDLLDRIGAMHTRLEFVLYVDDLSAHGRENTPELVAKVLEGGTAAIIETLENGWGMKVSRVGDGEEAGAKHKSIAVGRMRRSGRS